MKPDPYDRLIDGLRPAYVKLWYRHVIHWRWSVRLFDWRIAFLVSRREPKP
jgi:hypothetical protein